MIVITIILCLKSRIVAEWDNWLRYRIEPRTIGEVISKLMRLLNYFHKFLGSCLLVDVFLAQIQDAKVTCNRQTTCM